VRKQNKKKIRQLELERDDYKQKYEKIIAQDTNSPGNIKHPIPTSQSPNTPKAETMFKQQTVSDAIDQFGKFNRKLGKKLKAAWESEESKVSDEDRDKLLENILKITEEVKKARPKISVTKKVRKGIVQVVQGTADFLTDDAIREAINLYKKSKKQTK
jgi:hypothetical protein